MEKDCFYAATFNNIWALPQLWPLEYLFYCCLWWHMKTKWSRVCSLTSRISTLSSLALSLSLQHFSSDLHNSYTWLGTMHNPSIPYRCTTAPPATHNLSLGGTKELLPSLASCQLTISECKFPTKPLSSKLKATIFSTSYMEMLEAGDWWIQSSCLYLHIMPIRIIFSILRTKYHCVTAAQPRGSNDMKDYTLLRLLYFHSFSISDRMVASPMNTGSWQFVFILMDKVIDQAASILKPSELYTLQDFSINHIGNGLGW